MDTITRLAKSLLILLASVVLITSLSCSEDPSSPKKVDEDTIPQDAVTIGVEGGTVEKGDLTITIPAGAFDGNYDIAVNEVEDDGAFGENSVSTSYKINGLPSDYTKPLTVKSKYSGQLSGNTFLAIGQMARDKIEMDSSVVYGLYPATDSSGALTSSFPAFSNSNLSKSTKKNNELESLELFAKFLGSYAYKETNHFLIFFPLSAIQQVSKVEEMFEDAYAAVKHGLGVNEEILRTIILTSQNKPIIVNQEVFNQKYLVHRFSISKEVLDNQQYNDIQVRAAQELFFFSGTTIGFEDIHWIRSAIYNWIEDWISDAPDYQYPEGLFYNAMNPFSGFETFFQDDLAGYKHGKGMSGIIKYLYQLENYGLNGLKILRNKVLSSKLLVESVEIPMNQWWPDFFKKYVNNELFELPDDYFIENAHAEWDINSAEDVSKIFTYSYQDLSAKMFKINLNYADLKDTQNLKFKMIGPENNKDIALILFSIVNNKLEYIETTQLSEYEIINPKSYFSDGTGEFLVVLVNSNITQDDYLGESEINLEINVSQKEKTILDYKNSAFSCSLWGKYENKWADGSLHYWEGQFGMSSIQYVPGEFTGNVFKGELTITGYYSSAPNSVIEISLTAELNETLDLISNFEFIRVTTFNNDSKGIRTEKVAGGNIPISLSINAHYILNGLDVCNDEITFIYEDLFYSLDGGENYIKIIEVGCTEESNLYFTFVE